MHLLRARETGTRILWVVEIDNRDGEPMLEGF